MDKLLACPDVIYLQACDECYKEASRYCDGVTWCADYIGHECDDIEAKDIEYIRLSRLIEAVREIEKRQRTWNPKKDEESMFSEDYLKGKSSGLLDALFELEQHIPELKERKE